MFFDGLIALFIGFALARYFRVLILIPATIISMIYILTSNMNTGQTFSIEFLSIVIATCALQFGYFLGLIAKTFFADRIHAVIRALPVN
jgi:hypothetical protein